MGQPELRIPKVTVPVRVHTLPGEKLSGDVFLDYLHAEGYTLEQVLDFFNADPPFLPLRVASGNRAILIRKDALVEIELPELKPDVESDSISERKEVVFHMQSIGPVRCTIILDLPVEQSRVVDLLNQKRAFLSAQIHDRMVLLNTHHVYKIEEL